MTDFNEGAVSRADDGKFAAKTTGETQATLPDTPSEPAMIRAAQFTSPAIYRQELAGGGNVTYCDYGDGTRHTEYFDADGNEHREDGPAYIAGSNVSWMQHGVVHRDPMEGPAQINDDGTVEFIENGRTVHPEWEDAADLGIETDDGRMGDEPTYRLPHSTNPDNAMLRGRADLTTHPKTARYFHEHELGA